MNSTINSLAHCKWLNDSGSTLILLPEAFKAACLQEKCDKIQFLLLSITKWEALLLNTPFYNNIYSCSQLLSQLLLTFLSAAALLPDFLKTIPLGRRETAFLWPHLWFNKMSLFPPYQNCSLGRQPPLHTATSAYSQNARLIPQRGCNVWRFGRWLIWQRRTAYTGLWFEKNCFYTVYITILGIHIRNASSA